MEPKDLLLLVFSTLCAEKANFASILRPADPNRFCISLSSGLDPELEREGMRRFLWWCWSREKGVPIQGKVSPLGVRPGQRQASKLSDCRPCVCTKSLAHCAAGRNHNHLLLRGANT